MKWLADELITHRGYHNGKDIVENSMGAFREALKNGFGIELDIHATKDGKVVVFHDDTLTRMTGVNKVVEECTYNEIKSLTLLETDEHIPLLKDVLKEVNGKVGIMIELKNMGAPGILEEKTYELLKDYSGDFIVQSFNPLSLGWFVKNAPEFIRGQLAGSFKGEKLAWYKKFLLRNYLLNYISKPHFVNYDLRAINSLSIKWLRMRGRIIFGWTARTMEEYNDGRAKCINVVFECFDPRKH